MTPPTSNASHVYHDWDGSDDLSTSIGLCLADATGRGLDDLGPPLANFIDPDALTALLAPRAGDKGTVDRVRFTIDGHTVTVTNYAEVAHIAVHPDPDSSHELPAFRA